MSAEDLANLQHFLAMHGPSYRPALVALVAERDRLRDADKTITVLLEILPKLIVEAAESFRTAWLDGREPDLTDATLRARLDRIVREQFPSRGGS